MMTLALKALVDKGILRMRAGQPPGLVQRGLQSCTILGIAMDGMVATIQLL